MSLQIDTPLIPWKGTTLKQITASIRKNGSINSTLNKPLLFNPLPLKIYRKEIASIEPPHCKQRIAMSIDSFNMPNGYSIVPDSSQPNALVNTLDINLTENTYERPGTGTCDVCLLPANNALRRVRSSGMIKKKFTANGNVDTYYADNKQYLTSRSRTFEKNQYNYIRHGDPLVKPGNSLSKQNVYTSNTLNHCPKYHLRTETSFQYKWIDNTNHTVTLPAGYYDLNDVNTLFKNTMLENYHYYVSLSTHAYYFLLNITYDNVYDRLEIQALKTDTTTFHNSGFRYPLDPNAWVTPVNSIVPSIIISNNEVTTMFGIPAGTYPTSSINVTAPSYDPPDQVQTPAYTENQVVYSTSKPKIQPNFVPIYYKPNNPQFAVQGGVSSGAHLSRVKYDTITTAAYDMRNAFGQATADALAYGVPKTGYTLKDKTGYPNTCTPIVSKYTGEVKSCYKGKL